jgi:3-hydroxyisobutyrate dehydrogenase-like beta-hydroxyacid dehydrogenase
VGVLASIGLVGAGHMGSGLGWALREGGHRVYTSVAGRSDRTVRLAQAAGVEPLPDLATLTSTVDIILVVTPPGEALSAAGSIAQARSGQAPLVADLNAVSPSTMEQIRAVVPDVVDGAISGPPPTVHPGARIYLSGPRAGEIADLRWTHAVPVIVSDTVGDASAVKMCTASVYKGAAAIAAQALRTAAHYGVVDHVLADLAEVGEDPARQVAMAATKAWRYVPEMREIARAQSAAGQGDRLFEAIAEVFERLATTALAGQDPEQVPRHPDPHEVISKLL